MIRHRVQRQRAGRAEDVFLINLDPRQRGRFRPGGDQDVLGLIDLIPDLDLPIGGNAGPAFDQIDAVFLEQKGDALGQITDDLVLAPHHGGYVDAGPLDRNAMGGEMSNLGIFGRGGQQRLGRDTAHIQTCPAKSPAPFNAGNFHTQLRRADCGDISARAAPDDDEVIDGHWSSLSRSDGLRTGRGLWCGYCVRRPRPRQATGPERPERRRSGDRSG